MVFFCQEWEKNAHRGVSLQLMMSNISNLILRWRKLELSNWKPLLQQGYLVSTNEKCLKSVKIQLNLLIKHNVLRKHVE